MTSDSPLLDGRTKGLAAGTPPSTPAGCALAVGDLIGCAISHSCTTFDKWRFLPVVDDVTTWS